MFEGALWAPSNALEAQFEVAWFVDIETPGTRGDHPPRLSQSLSLAFMFGPRIGPVEKLEIELRGNDQDIRPAAVAVRDDGDAGLGFKRTDAVGTSEITVDEH